MHAVNPLGASTEIIPSLDDLCERYLGFEMGEEDHATVWRGRPLLPDAVLMAASRAQILLPLLDAMEAEPTLSACGHAWEKQILGRPD